MLLLFADLYEFVIDVYMAMQHTLCYTAIVVRQLAHMFR